MNALNAPTLELVYDAAVKILYDARMTMADTTHVYDIRISAGWRKRLISDGDAF